MQRTRAITIGLVTLACSSACAGTATSASKSAESKSAISTSVVSTAAVSKSPCLTFVSPTASSAPATYVNSAAGGNGLIDVVRIDNRKSVQTLAPPCSQLSRLHRVATRNPNGTLLIGGYLPEIPGSTANYHPFWHDRTYTRTFQGSSAAVSPDGRRIATLIPTHGGSEIVRQYNAATGKVMSDLTAVKPHTTQTLAHRGSAGSVLGFDWSTNGQSLVVTMEPGFETVGGLYVVPRTAHVLPTQPTVPDMKQPSDRVVFASPAVLRNGHVIALAYQSPIQHDGWAGAVVDINVRTKASRIVFGKPDVLATGPPCDGVKPGQSVKAVAGSCRLEAAGLIDAYGNLALVTDGEGIVWLYNGTTMHRLTSTFGNVGYW